METRRYTANCIKATVAGTTAARVGGENFWHIVTERELFETSTPIAGGVDEPIKAFLGFENVDGPLVFLPSSDFDSLPGTR